MSWLVLSVWTFWHVGACRVRYVRLNLEIGIETRFAVPWRIFLSVSRGLHLHIEPNGRDDAIERADVRQESCERVITAFHRKLVAIRIEHLAVEHGHRLD